MEQQKNEPAILMSILYSLYSPEELLATANNIGAKIIIDPTKEIDRLGIATILANDYSDAAREAVISKLKGFPAKPSFDSAVSLYMNLLSKSEEQLCAIYCSISTDEKLQNMVKDSGSKLYDKKAYIDLIFREIYNYRQTPSIEDPRSI